MDNEENEISDEEKFKQMVLKMQEAENKRTFRKRNRRKKKAKRNEKKRKY